MRRVPPVLGTALLLLAACAGPFPVGWLYVTGTSATGATVVWTRGCRAQVSCRAADGVTPASPETVREHGVCVARLAGLAPSTRYRCRVGGKRAVRFRTAPAGSEAFTFAAVGDTGDGTRQAAALARRILAGRPAFLIHLGDLAYRYARADTLDERFFAPYRHVLERIPLFPTPGNHDLQDGSVYRDVFAPVGGEANHGRPRYAFDWGAAHFVSVSSPDFDGDGADGTRWLADDLAAARRPWRIVFLHEPPFDPGRKWVVRGLRTGLEPVVEKAHVDLLLAGHVHLYERAEPACLFVPEASVLQVVSGGGGANLDPAVAHPNFPRSVSATHYLRVHVSADAIDVRAIGLSGEILDHVRRRRGDSVPCRATGWPKAREK